MKLYRLLISVCVIAASAASASADAVDEFSLSFAGRPTVNNVVYSDTLDEQTRNKYNIPNNNVIASDDKGTPYVAHMANNSFVWERQEDGSYEKRYGGIEGFYGYYNQDNTVKTYAITNSTLTRNSVSVLNMAGNVLQILGIGNSGYNLYGSFGKYDLNLGGSSVFKTTIAKLGVNGGKSTVTMSLCRNKAAESDKCTGEYHFLKIDTSYDIYFDGASEPCGKIERGESFNTVPTFYEVSYYLDNTGDIPRHALVVKNETTGELAASVPMTEIAQRNTSYDFTEPEGGIRVKNEGSNEWSGNARLLVKDMNFSQIKPLAAITSDRYYAENPLLPETENQAIEIMFDKKLMQGTINTENIKLVAENGEQAELSAVSDGGNGIRIVPEPLAASRTYTLSLCGIAAEDFSTAPDLAYTVKVKDTTDIVNVEKSVTGLSAELSFDVKSNSGRDEAAVIFVSRSSAGGIPRQGGIYFKNIKIPAGQVVNLTLSPVALSSEEETEDIYRIYVWRSFLNPVALAGAVLK